MTYTRIHPFDLFVLLEKLGPTEFWTSCNSPAGIPGTVRIDNAIYLEDRTTPPTSEWGKQLLSEACTHIPSSPSSLVAPSADRST